MVLHLASVEEKRRLWWRNAAINALLTACWFTFATAMSMYNKWLVSPAKFNFPFPLFSSSVQMPVQFVLAALCRYGYPKYFRPARNPSRRDYATKVVPTAMATALDVGLGNASLRIIDLSLYTMVKSSSLIFVLVFAFLLRLEPFSFRLVSVVLLISFGVFLMAYQATAIVIHGVLLVLAAASMAGFRWSFTQILLHRAESGLNTPAATIFWFAPIMGAGLALISMALEGWRNVFASPAFEHRLATAGYLAAPGVLAYIMVMSEFYVLKRIGIVPMSVLGIVKELFTVSVAAIVFRERLTVLRLTGLAVTIVGIGLYTYHKYERSLSAPVPLDAHGNPLPLPTGAADYADERAVAAALRESGEAAAAAALLGGDEEEAAALLAHAHAGAGEDDALLPHGAGARARPGYGATEARAASQDGRAAANDAARRPRAQQ